MIERLNLPQEERTYLQELTNRLRTTLGSSLVAVYLVGSAARNAYIVGQSDLDVQAVISDTLPPTTYTSLASVISHSSLPCPASKLEFVLYTSAEAQAVRNRAPKYEINFNTGRTMPNGDYLSLDSAKDDPFWFILDIAASWEVAVPLLGPPITQTFTQPPRELVLKALKESLEWHEGEERGPNGLANAARAWRWVKEGLWGSKKEGVEWAKKQGTGWSVLDAEKEQRGGGKLDEEEVGRFLLFVREEVEAAMQRE
ncbi:hypothetical protein BCR35DRAFT_286510 [Leucosporidium creatinivorum]|uniref:Adenylyltransferase AadA C-terminal domain-containing protein n=1 Tax=Leucosporidium creatinivorum TaxID=106004 RepID=A0A1Y2G6E0_9BASI|nr:hypothetical protein BCR35DRAFT_286510 [Leucosporidium creatinivorum]